MQPAPDVKSGKRVYRQKVILKSIETFENRWVSHRWENIINKKIWIINLWLHIRGKTSFLLSSRREIKLVVPIDLQRLLFNTYSYMCAPNSDWSSLVRQWVHSCVAFLRNFDLWDHSPFCRRTYADLAYEVCH